MKILLYHKDFCKPEETILERAARKEHLFRKTVWWEVLLFVLTGIGGTLLFLFSPVLMRIPVLCIFVPVRNSIWESLKLLYMPSVLTGLLRWFFTGNLQKGILTTYAEGICLTLTGFVTLHYLCTGILGREYFKADMLFFYACVIFLIWYLRIRADRQKKSSLPGVFVIFLLTGCFIYFTCNPPALGLFAEISLLLQ